MGVILSPLGDNVKGKCSEMFRQKQFLKMFLSGNIGICWADYDYMFLVVIIFFCYLIEILLYTVNFSKVQRLTAIKFVCRMSRKIGLSFFWFTVIFLDCYQKMTFLIDARKQQKDSIVCKNSWIRSVIILTSTFCPASSTHYLTP